MTFTVPPKAGPFLLHMDNYIKISITVTDEQEQELLLALLSEEGYDGFEETEDQLIAYISEQDFNESQLTALLQPFSKAYQKEVIAPRNWNQEWEQNYEPVIVNDFVAVRAHFHQPITTVQYEIVITPKMSFGTGHHATTWQMMKQMQQIDFNNKTVFDFGCGTGVLAILAEKLGATDALAIDNDEICVENSLENLTNNHCKNIRVEKATAPPEEKKFDIILANINRHILLATMGTMAAALNSNGHLLISGFYAAEDQLLIEAASMHQFKLQQSSERNQWSCLLFNKQA